MVDNKLVCPEGKPVNLVSLHQDITDLQEQINYLHAAHAKLTHFKAHFHQPLMIDDQELKEELQKIKAQEEQRKDD